MALAYDPNGIQAWQDSSGAFRYDDGSGNYTLSAPPAAPGPAVNPNVPTSPMPNTPVLGDPRSPWAHQTVGSWQWANDPNDIANAGSQDYQSRGMGWYSTPTNQDYIDWTHSNPVNPGGSSWWTSFGRPAAEFVGGTILGAASGNPFPAASAIYGGSQSPSVDPQVSGLSNAYDKNVANFQAQQAAQSGGGGMATNYVPGGAGTAANGLVTPQSGGLWNGLFGAGAQLGASQQLNNSYIEAQKNAQSAGQFTPWNVYSGVGSTQFGPGGVTTSLNPQYQGIQQQALQNAQGGLGALNSYDPNQMSNQLYGQMQAQAAPYEAQDRSNALAQIQAMGQTGLGVGGDQLSGPSNPLYSSLLRAQAGAAQQRQLNAMGQSQDIANQMLGRANTQLGMGTGLDQMALGNAQIGAGLGSTQTNAALNAARIAQQPILAQGAAKAGMLSGLGQGLFGAGGIGGAGALGSQLGGLGNAIGSGASSAWNWLTGGGGGNLPAPPPGAASGGYTLDASGAPVLSSGAPQAMGDFSGVDPSLGYMSGGGDALNLGDDLSWLADW